MKELSPDTPPMLSVETIERWRLECRHDGRNRAAIFPSEWEALCSLAIQAASSEIATPGAAETLPPAEAYVLAIHQSIGSILSPYAAKKIMDRAKEISNGN